MQEADGSDQQLEGWKAIAAFFGRDVRTMKRWEVERRLPVHRYPHSERSRVYAFASELRAWRAADGEPAGMKPGLTQTQDARDAGPPEVRPPTRRRLWAGTVLAAVAVVAGLGLVVTRTGRKPVSHVHPPAAVEAYRIAVMDWNARSAGSLQSALSEFHQAVSDDPTYAEAYVGIANCYDLLREYGAMPSSEAYPQAEAAVKRALQLDPDLASAHATMGFVTFWWEWDPALADQEFSKAIALDPALVTAHQWRATMRQALGLFDQATVEIDRAQTLDPGSPSVLADKAAILLSAGRVQDATRLLQHIAATHPDMSSPHVFLSQAYFFQGDYGAYLREASTAATLKGDPVRRQAAAALRAAWERSGKGGLVNAMLSTERALLNVGLSDQYAIARAYGLAGDRNAALTALDAAVRQHNPDAIAARADLAFKAWRGDADFNRLLPALSHQPT